jgi:hypothetical protein
MAFRLEEMDLRHSRLRNPLSKLKELVLKKEYFHNEQIIVDDEAARVLSPGLNENKFAHRSHSLRQSYRAARVAVFVLIY